MGERPAPRGRGERATALMLAPALVLVVIVLGALAVDLTLVHTARRSAYRSLSAAADDAAAMLDGHHFQATGEERIDPAAAERVARGHLGLLGGTAGPGTAPPAFEVRSARVRTDTLAGTVTITATVRVDHILLPALPGGERSSEFDMTVTGRML